MGRATFSVDAYTSATRAYAPSRGPVTRIAELKAYDSGKLEPLVDPAEFGVIRRSLLRFEQRPDGLYVLTVGTSMPVESYLDTTGSMGNNVEIAFKALPDLYDLCSGVLTGYDLHLAIGIFGDCADKFVLNRPQFEMLAEKIVEQLTMMVPEHGGAGNGGEDPQYALVASAYLTRAYINCIGLKRYMFVTTDEPAREYLSEQQLIRIFGKQVFEKMQLNGFDIDPNDLPTTREVVQDLLKQAHAFALLVGDDPRTTRFWTEHFGPERVVRIPDVRLLPQMQAIIIGLTEGTLALDQVGDFLSEHRVSKEQARQITRSVSNIPIGAQAALREELIRKGRRIPQAGDLFLDKPDVFNGTNIWPLNPGEVPDVAAADSTPEPVAPPTQGPAWL